MTAASYPLSSVHRSPFTVCYLLSVIHDPWLIANGKRIENSKWTVVNSTGGAL